MTTGYETERSDIEQRVLSVINSTNTPIKFDNVQHLVKGTSVVETVNGLSEYIRVTILNNDSETIEIGGTRTRHNGEILFSIFVTSGTGTDRARELADDLYDGFKNRAIGTVQTQTPTVNRIGDDEGFYHLQVSVPFYRDQT